ncbi:electron transfer flavoprotein subunit alpha/FixB family protein [Methylopila sp. Yamaguchi]|uniref:electron transfer flavoprotein subunit alpha/FixB family protein n=1 Tax=Methylopila sp. Yamaguchi TaxID=1437817 RepID=UPI000CBAB65B|nr:electron transfer flavoprotein subunit alpha/FixB family protein [Methylopila sp. Yamaguchi]GBD50373.1 electron transfer flavoprotein subunit alpha [Methylopila sp. Yamaguchi]
MTRARRDPRAERAAAALPGAARARFDLFARCAGGRPRRDPRMEAAAQRVDGAARLRLDRAQTGRPAAAPAPSRAEPAAPPAPKTIVMAAPAFLVAVVPDLAAGRLSPHDRQLFGAARTLAGADGGVIALAGAEGAELGPAGADRTARLAGPEGYAPDARAAAIASTMAALNLRHVIFPETPDGGDLARRVAVLAGEPLFADVEMVSAAALMRPAQGRRVEQRAAPARLITLAADAVAPYAGAPREARDEPLEPSAAPASAILAAERIPADPARTPLALADFVVSAGNGVTDLETFRAVAAALGGTPGASRVLCDAGLMPREAQVGASGTVLSATCYLALGIAGAPQHLQGVAGCEHVVAVNTDLHAAMIERAGLAIVQDAQVVMPALIEELARERGAFA